MEFESIVRPTHLSRTAFIYPRQSDPKQVRENSGSRDYQLDQVDFARRLGWKDENIRIIDKDLGRSGTTTIGRASYQEMVGELRLGRVGGIFVSALDRAGRNVVELLTLLEDCANFDTLLVPDGKPIDLTNSDQFTVQGVLAVLAGAEIGKMRKRMKQGIVGRLSHGFAVHRPPGGYVVPSKGKWEKDPELRARTSLDTTFQTLLTLRSFPKAARALRKQGVELPRRVRVRDEMGNLPEVDDGVRVLEFAPVTENALLSLATNPNYTPDCVYGRERVDSKLGRGPNGKYRKRRAAKDELQIIPNHHEPYISHEQFAELQHIIAVNRPSRPGHNLKCGGALLDGALLRCALHRNRAMRVRYQVDRQGHGRWRYYGCDGELLEGGAGCKSVAGAALEAVVARAVLDRLNSPSIEELRAAWAVARIAEGGDDNRRDVELTRAVEEVKKARRKCQNVDEKKYPQAAQEHIEWLEEAKTNLQKLQSLSALPRTTISLFTDEVWQTLIALSAERQALWDASTTTVQDQRELVRTFVKAVIMESLRPDQAQRGRIVWQDGAPDSSFEIPTRISVRTLILALEAEGLHPREIAERLNQLGLKNLQGKPWSWETVWKRIAADRQRRRAHKENKAA